MKELTKEEQKAADERFRELCKDYEANHSKEVWDEMWMIVKDASGSMVKKMLKGVDIDDIDEVIIDTTAAAMDKIRKEFNKNGKFELKNKLVTFCRSYSLWFLYSPSRKFNDRVISYESYISTHGDNVSDNH